MTTNVTVGSLWQFKDSCMKPTIFNDYYPGSGGFLMSDRFLIVLYVGDERAKILTSSGKVGWINLSWIKSLYGNKTWGERV